MTSIPLPHISGMYRHYKGNEYIVQAITRDADTLELRIVYIDEDMIQWDRRVTGIDPKTGEPSGWCDPLPDGSERFTLVKFPD